MRQEMRQLLTPRMIQSMEILQLPLMALEERIEEELQEERVRIEEDGRGRVDDVHSASDDGNGRRRPLAREELLRFLIWDFGFRICFGFRI